jgi:hypothetical protein
LPASVFCSPSIYTASIAGRTIRERLARKVAIGELPKDVAPERHAVRVSVLAALSPTLPFISWSVLPHHMDDSAPSPIESAAGAAGPEALDDFALLANETRLGILLALWEAYDPLAEDNAVSFTELRDRVGLRQGGQFNYHLDKVVGRFVRKTDDGYELRRTGLILVQSIIAGTGMEAPTLDPTEIDDTCEYCGAPTAITYENVYVYRVCTECQGWATPNDHHPSGALSGWTFEPTGLSGRTVEEVFAASTIRTFGWIAMRFEGLCPMCSGAVEWTLDICEEHEPASDGRCPTCGRSDAVLAREACTVCKSAGAGSPGIKILFHPAVVSFFYERGVDVGFTGDTDFDDAIRILNLAEEFGEEVLSVDPPRVRVTVSHGGDEIHLLLDEDMNVLDVTEGAETSE